ncbi:MAG: hypothetical protein A3H96_10780 [Acidobacteria bacterium RIFCSPLOWO2_02_FULL_67_36]|nr:MAG: hypothetical protein A3H96_10780 [Acidobacteria bacterium RIFCSPLOWO2_02_FULL_67_36]OFW24341.1 MAG: hypothetical protein A3G21_17390 [Acidobacteria bacterium RIFCSPLOWO2_12_FULL_66_21]
MDAATLPTPVLTRLDAVTQALAAVCYLAIGVAALFRARHDIRTRVFFAFAIANVVAFLIPAIGWKMGVVDPTTLPRPATAAMLAGLGVGALLLFHFTQVFPRKRPWIRTAGIQMPVAYALAPVVIVALVWFWPNEIAQMSPAYVIGFLLFGFPLIVLLGLVLPVTAIMSLVRSYYDAREPELAPARPPLATILASQIAGGALALVFAPVLAVIAPNSTAQTVLTLVIWGLGMLTPIAFAAAVWKYGVLSIDPES